MRVYELAKEFSIKSTDLVNKIRKDWKIPVRSYMEELTPQLEKKIRQQFESEKQQKKPVPKKTTVRVRKVRSTPVVKKAEVAQTESQGTVEIEKKVKPKKNVIRRKSVEVKPVGLESVEKKVATPKPEPVVSKKEQPSLKEDLLAWSSDSTGKEEADLESKKKFKKAGEKEEVAQKFRASDFRKREVIFQPKKKRNLQSHLGKKTLITKPKSHKRQIKFYGSLSVQDLSHQMGIKVKQLLDKLKKEGLTAEPSTLLDFDIVTLVAHEFGFEAKNEKKTFLEVAKELKFGDGKAESVIVPPIVTIMGHVDHGKTTLLDFLRKTRVVTKEAGGITQHIGAYSLPVGKSFVTFVDTPGHEAFAEMRARGAQVTNIVVIVVAADDGVRPQTIEAIQHAQASKVPILVAINKMDKQGVDPEKVKQQMSEHNLVPEEWGGDVIFVPISALKGTGTKELLEQILLVAEMQEIKANPKQSAEGVVIESRMEKGRGWVVTLIVQDGTLKKSEYIMTPSLVGRVRQMTNDQGKSVSSVSPGFPVEISGFDEAPQVGDKFFAVKNEKEARDFIMRKKSEGKENQLDKKSIEELLALQTKDIKKLSLIVKADVAGSLEALKNSLDKISSENVELNIIHSGLGGITENDVLRCATAQGEIFGFNVRPDSKTEKLAKEYGVSIWTYTIIYEFLDGVKKRAIGLLDPDVHEEITSKSEVREVFHISKLGSIAGSMVVSGKIGRQNLARVIRDGRVIYDGQISSLRRFKDDVKEVAENFECGIGLHQFNDMKPGDVIESYVKKETARTEL